MSREVKKTKLTFKKSTHALFVGYLVIMLLFLAVFVLGLKQLSLTDRQIKTIVNNNNVKTGLLVTMQSAARERSLALYRMVNQLDPFDRDDTLMEFSRLGRVFLTARNKLKQMNLSNIERQLLDKQGKESIFAINSQQQIIELAHNEQFQEANSVLVNKSIPDQNAVLDTLGKLIALQHRNSEVIAQKLSQSLNNNILLIVISGSITFLLSILIAVLVTRHITKTEKNLYLEKELAQVTLQSIGDGIVTVDKNYNIQTLNPAAEVLTGISQDDAKNKNILTLYSTEDSNTLKDTLKSDNHSKSIFDFTLQHNDDITYEIEHKIAPIIDQSNNIYGAVIILRDVTAVRNMEKRLSYQASHDSLTNLINRREFETRLEHAIHRASVDEMTFSLCFLDLDKFKIINDTCGHAAGDEFLKQISSTIQACLRNTDVLARLGGDEFGIVLEGCSLKVAKRICNKIIEQIKSTRFVWGNFVFESGASIGIVPIDKFTTSVSDIMGVVDAACYEAKDKGRNRVQIFEPENEDFVRHQQETSWIQIINSAIENNEFEIYAQEILAINPSYPTPKTIEILVRLNHNDTLFGPDSFIPTAERNNLMPMIDSWVIHNTFKFMNEYKKATNEDIRVAINLSGQSLTNDSVLNLISILLKENTQLKKELICFEITETAAIANLSRAIEFITNIKQIGCKFSLDDFGSGLSSFSYLKNMPVDNLKIDGVFIRDIAKDKIDRAFVESIHNIGKMMGIKTTAEYVENQDILDCIKSIGIDYAQGYHIAKPAPVYDLLTNFLSEQELVKTSK